MTTLFICCLRCNKQNDNEEIFPGKTAWDFSNIYGRKFQTSKTQVNQIVQVSKIKFELKSEQNWQSIISIINVKILKNKKEKMFLTLHEFSNLIDDTNH